MQAVKARNILKAAGFQLTKWFSNRSFANERLQYLNDKINCTDFNFWGCPEMRQLTNLLLPGRSLPLGFVCLSLIFPFTLTTKILFQDIGRQSLECDAPLPVTELERCEA